MTDSTFPSPTGIRYAHTNLVTGDYERAVRFYVNIFGCVPVGAPRNHHGEPVETLTGLSGARAVGGHLRLPGHGENGPTLEVFEYTPLGTPGSREANMPGFAHIAFEVPDVDSITEQVLQAGGSRAGKTLLLDIPGAGKLHLVYLRDPDGNIIELQNWLDRKE